MTHFSFYKKVNLYTANINMYIFCTQFTTTDNKYFFFLLYLLHLFIFYLFLFLKFDEKEKKSKIKYEKM